MEKPSFIDVVIAMLSKAAVQCDMPWWWRLFVLLWLLKAWWSVSFWDFFLPLFVLYGVFLPPLIAWDKMPNRVVFDSSLKNVRDKLKKHQRTPTCLLYPSRAEFQRFKNHFPIWLFAKMAVIQHRLDLLKHYAKVSSAGWLKSAQCLHPTRLKKLFLCWSSSHFLSLWLDVIKSSKPLIVVNDDISHLEMILLPPPPL